MKAFNFYGVSNQKLKDIYQYNIYLNFLNMEIFDFIVKAGPDKTTMLDKEYRRLINNVISTNNEEVETRWEIYNMIIKEFFKTDGGKYFQEIKYRLTDGENPNNVILEIISRYKESELSYLVWNLKKRIEEYAEDDFFKRFFD